jgi:hypothetical protein
MVAFPAAAWQPPGRALGGDRVLVRQLPDRSRSPQPTAYPDKDGKYTAGFENAFSARGDARAPRQGLLEPLMC